MNTVATPPKSANGCIYLFTFPNGKKYVGLTERGVADRCKNHEKNAKLQHNDLAVTRALRKYGCENVMVTVLHEGLPLHKLVKLEPMYIRQLDTFGKRGYNLTSGGEGTPDWFSLKSDEDKETIRARSSMVLTAIWQDPEKRAHFEKASRKYTNSEEHREAARARLIKLQQDPVFVEKARQAREASRKSEKWWKNFRASIEKRKTNVEWRAAQGKRLRKYYDDPENKRKSLDRLAEMNRDPEFQKRRLDACRKTFQSEEWLKKQRENNRSRSKISDSEIIHIRDLLAYGFNAPEISKLYRVAVQTIYNTLKRIPL